MASLDEMVAALLDGEFYKAETIPLLEEHVRAQVVKGTYNVKVNRGLLKLYRMFPSQAKAGVVHQILVKSLMALPEPDFLLNLYLSLSSNQAEEPIASLMELERLLQLAQFASFWKKAAEPTVQSVVATVPGFEAAIQDFIAKALNRTYQKIDTAPLAVAMHVADVAPSLSKYGWTFEGSMVVLSVLPENSSKPKKVIDEGTKYGDVAGLVQTLTR